MNSDLDALRYFVHVAAASSFVKAAKLAHVSPPAVSKAIRKLEDDLGAKLFERTTRRVKLTAAGQVALARCRKVLADLDGLGAEIAATAGRPRGPLRIAAMEVFSIELLPRAVAALVREHDEVMPFAYEMIPQRMNDALVAGELDIAFSIGARPAAGIALHDLGTTPGVLVCGRGHPLFGRGRITPAELRHHGSVVPRFFGAEHLPSLDQFPEERHPRRVTATIELLQMGVELVLAGGFLGYFPAISVQKYLASGELRALRGVARAGPFQLHALTRADVPLEPAAAWLLAWIKAALSRTVRPATAPRSRRAARTRTQPPLSRGRARAAARSRR